MALLATEVSVIGHPAHSAIGRLSNTDSRSADLAAPKGRAFCREIPILCAEVALQLHGIACGERQHRLQPECSGLGDMRSTDLAPRPADFGRAVQDKPPTHPCRRAGVHRDRQLAGPTLKSY